MRICKVYVDSRISTKGVLALHLFVEIEKSKEVMPMPYITAN